MKPVTSATTCVLAATLAAAGAASADFHVDPSGHGGPTARATTAAAASAGALMLGGHSRQHQPVVATVSKDRRRLVLDVAYSGACASGDPSSGSTNFAAAKVRKDGRYAITKTLRMRFDDGSMLIESYGASGRLGRSTTSGTLRVKDAWFTPDGSADDVCDTGQQSFKLRRSGMFAGTTSDGNPVVLEYAPGRDRITSLLVPWTAQCNSGQWAWDTAELAGPVGVDGTFGGSVTDTRNWAPGQTGNGTATFGGVLSRRSAIGNWRMTISVTDASQAEVDSCDSGAIGFRLK